MLLDGSMSAIENISLAVATLFKSCYSINIMTLAFFLDIGYYSIS